MGVLGDAAIKDSLEREMELFLKMLLPSIRMLFSLGGQQTAPCPFVPLPPSSSRLHACWPSALGGSLAPLSASSRCSAAGSGSAALAVPRLWCPGAPPVRGHGWRRHRAAPQHGSAMSVQGAEHKTTSQQRFGAEGPPQRTPCTELSVSSGCCRTPLSTAPAPELVLSSQ